MPDRPGRAPADVSVAVVEPVARGVPAAGGAAARLLAVLRSAAPEVGVRMPRSVWAIEPTRGGEMSEQRVRGGATGPSSPGGRRYVSTHHGLFDVYKSATYITLVLGLEKVIRDFLGQPIGCSHGPRRLRTPPRRPAVLGLPRRHRAVQRPAAAVPPLPPEVELRPQADALGTAQGVLPQRHRPPRRPLRPLRLPHRLPGLHAPPPHPGRDDRRGEAAPARRAGAGRVVLRRQAEGQAGPGGGRESGRIRHPGAGRQGLHRGRARTARRRR